MERRQEVHSLQGQWKKRAWGAFAQPSGSEARGKEIVGSRNGD